MRKLTALLLTLALLCGLGSSAMAKSAYTLDIYWIANRDDPEIRAGVEEAVNEYLGELYENREVKANMQSGSSFFPISCPPSDRRSDCPP